MSQFNNISLSKYEPETYNAVWDAYPDAVVIVDYFGNIVLVNQKAEGMFGFTPGEMIGYSVEALLPDVLSKTLQKCGQEYMDSPLKKETTPNHADNQNHVLTALKKDQSEFYVNINMSPLKIGKHDLVAVFIKDVTIKENLERRFHKMVGEIQDYSIVFLDVKGDITNWNKGVERILGLTEEEIMGENYKIFFSKEDQKSLKPEMLLEKAKVNGRAEHEGWIIKKDGSLFWASVILTAIYNNRDRVLGFSKVTHDLTERMKAEQMVKSQAEELQVKNKELENFTYIASHDLQEPLSTVTSMIELIREESEFQFNQDTEEYFSFIEDAVERMRNLIKGLLKYSRLGRNRELVKVNIQDLIEDVQGDLNTRIKDEKAIIEIVDPLPEIPAFSVELRLLFQNIISNALKFYSAERSPHIKIFAKEYGSYWKFSIEDNGIGIKKNYLSKIFVIFQRLNDKSLYKGDGIGLAHCKKIVEIHEGSIWAESEFGTGTTIFFTISKNLKSAEEVVESVHEY